VRRDISSWKASDIQLSDDARLMLDQLSQWGRLHNVRIAYSVPWEYVRPENIAAFGKERVRFLREIAEHIPVLKDESLGANTNREQFADTNWHLTRESSPLRTDSFALQLKNWNVWSLAELGELQKKLSAGGPRRVD
jgi:hypothetical protein